MTHILADVVYPLTPQQWHNVDSSAVGAICIGTTGFYPLYSGKHDLVGVLAIVGWGLFGIVTDCLAV